MFSCVLLIDNENDNENDNTINLFRHYNRKKY